MNDTLKDIVAEQIAKGNDAAADAAYELWKGDRKPELIENTGEDRDRHPAYLVLDGIKVPLTGHELNCLANQAAFILVDHIERMGDDPLRQSELVDREDMDEAFNDNNEAQIQGKSAVKPCKRESGCSQLNGGYRED